MILQNLSEHIGSKGEHIGSKGEHIGSPLHICFVKTEKIHLLFLIIILAFFTRLYGMDWGIVHYEVQNLSEGVRGTVYTFMPDEKEFLGCYRALADSYGKFAGAVPFTPDFETIKNLALGFIEGKITFAPVMPTTATPLMTYLVFFFSVPFVGIKYLLSCYTVLNTNAVFYDSLLVGRFLTSFFDVLSILAVYEIMKLLEIKKSVSYAICAIFALMPAHIIVSHLLSYNSLVTLLELLTLHSIMSFSKENNPHVFFRGAIFAGLALSAKFSAVTLLPLFAIVPFLLPEFRMNIKNALKLIAKAYAIIFFSWLIIILYGVLTQSSLIIESLVMYFQNLVSKPGLALVYPKTILLKNYFFNTLPTGFSWSVYITLIFSALWLIFSQNSPRSKTHLIFYGYTLLWILGSANSSLAMLTRLLSVFTLLLICIAIFLDRVFLRWIFVAIILIDLSVNSFILLRFYSSPDIRFTASEWIEKNIPVNSTIGFHYDFPYWYHPVSIFTDFHWNKEKHFRYIPLALIVDSDTKIDYLITTKAEMEKAVNVNKISNEEYSQRIMNADLKLIKTFSPNLSLWFWKIKHESNDMFLNNIFVSDIYIYKTISYLSPTMLKRQASDPLSVEE